MRLLFIIFIYLHSNFVFCRKLVDVHGVTGRGGNLLRGNISIAISHSNYSNSKYLIKEVAVFLLGSLMNAFSLGYPRKDQSSVRDYFQRAVAARLTWARHVSFFYIVTGNGPAERMILSNPTSSCSNLTTLYKNMIPHGRFEMYECGTEVKVLVLHLPHCNGEAWGPNAACCRCQGAMTFYYDMHHYYQLQSMSSNPFSSSNNSGVSNSSSHLYEISNRNHHNKHNSNNNNNRILSHHYPNWMTFSDDDYYVRMTYLESVLSNPRTPSTGLYVVHGAGGGDEVITPGGSLPPIRKTGYGSWLFNHNCSVPCTHRMPWLSWAGFSIGAVRHLEPSLRRNELVGLCTRWGITHDVGLGVYVWMNDLTAIRIFDDHPSVEHMGAALWHKPKLLYDEMFEKLWLEMVEKKSKTDPAAVASVTRPQEFHMDTYYKNEVEAGRQHWRNRERGVPVYKMSGVKNTLAYRLHAYNLSLHQQQQQQQQTNSDSDSNDTYHHRRSNSDGLYSLQKAFVSGSAGSRHYRSRNVHSYNGYMLPYCDKDMKIYKDWLAAYSPDKSNTSMQVLATYGDNEPAICYAFNAYVSSIKLTAADLARGP